jgi:broad specificity phosphatase PhoE
MGKIYLLRHGQANLLGADYDRLSDLGRRQGERAGAALLAQGVHPVVFASGALKRQADTARHAAEAAGWRTALETDADFDEYAHADLFGAAFPQFSDYAALSAHIVMQPNPRRAFQDLFEQAFAAWLAGAARAGGLSWRGFRERALGAVARIAKRCGEGESAVVVTSGGVIAAIAQGLLGVPDSETLKLHNPLYNASITRLMTRGEDIALSGFNDIAHLAPDAALVTYR